MRRSFDIKVLRRRAKKMMRKKYKKTIRLTDLDLIWKDYVEYGIIRPLIKYGKVVVDEYLTIEIVGQRVENSKAYTLLSKGLTLGSKGIKPIEKVNKNRPGLTYKILLTDTTYKNGKVVFDVNPKLSKRVSDHLFNTLQPYRIAG